MSDKNYDNDPIERFFRKKAQNYDISYNEEDWLELENRLDKADQQLANRRWRQMAAAAIALLFAVLAFFTYQQQLKINELSTQLSNSQNAFNLPDNFTDLIPDNSTVDKSEGGQDEVDDEDTIDEGRDNNKAIAPSEKSTPGDDDLTQNNDPESGIDSNIQQLARADLEVDYLATSPAKMTPGFDGRSPTLTAIRPIKFDQRATGTDQTSQVKNREAASTADNAGAISTQQKISRFSMGLQMGPDISTVNSLSNFSRPGHKIGLSVEYNITKNLALTTGAQYTKVQYVGSGNEYRLPEGYLPYGTAPGEMKGVCLLIDIPVSLKYDFLHFHGSRIFASAGFSSYIMLNEDYRFTYKDNQSVLTQRWEERTGTRHWLSNGTLSVGYELDLNHNISIRAEPFLKVPIKEVGWGNVDLYSMGSFFSIHYNW